MQDALLMGFAKHGPDCPGHDVCFGGSIIEIQMVIGILGLEPTPDTRETISAVVANGGPRSKDDAVLTFVNEHGSYCTLRPMGDAASLIASAMGQVNPPF